LAAAGSAPTLVLVVDDDADLRESVRGMLRELGHAVVEAGSAEEAEALATLPGLGLVLTDLSLGGARSGLDLAEALAARAGAPPIGLMTALPATDPLRRRAARRWPLIAKPFTGAELAAFLAERLAA
ncbi:MAG: response regulator, partial [Alphaproteobacteria bacterium]